MVAARNRREYSIRFPGRPRGRDEREMERVTAAEAKAAATTAAVSASGRHALDFADRLREAADLLHAQGANPYRVAAYRKAADTIGRLPDGFRITATTPSTR